MMRKTCLIAILTVVLTALAGCGSDSGGKAADPRPIGITGTIR